LRRKEKEELNPKKRLSKIKDKKKPKENVF